MEWERLGLLDLAAAAGAPWTATHATLPTPDVLPDGTVRVYFSTADARGRSRPYVVDVDPADPTRALAGPRGPLVELGDPGCFDDNGVVVTSVVHGPSGAIYLYYVGFELCVGIRYRLFTGLAISTDGGTTFARHGGVPVLDRTDAERFFRCGPHVRYEGGRFRMWYVAGSDWTDVGGRQLPVYDIRYAESADGIVWPDEGERIVVADDVREHGLGRPWIDRRNGTELLLLSVRDRAAASYRLGCATREETGAYRRCDDVVGLDVSAAGFDDEAISYLAVADTPAGTLGFYNGNGFGAAGIGVVRLLDAA
ncbi:MAG: hypothetical protein QOE98_3031 [Gaiellaceae bacterium]|nr:hypothetical protein [Gaiellaceae bacterium]